MLQSYTMIFFLNELKRNYLSFILIFRSNILNVRGKGQDEIDLHDFLILYGPKDKDFDFLKILESDSQIFLQNFAMKFTARVFVFKQSSVIINSSLH